ncbi:hypothetical protein K1T71_013733 [Dendrolimus kikuchii]|uniref:Uncharacterized protein n=1 Tax=Dendrolimus kikuchii TaxID=765133 RepID=A0ACC1CHK1_9NEOP|nr:hypothetical protein K1T71_013733 [Dendrolimus kikuchii]
MNYIHNISKSSLKSSSSSRKSLAASEEVSKLQSEIELLKDTVASLKVSLESKDAAIGMLAREKEKIFVELKTTQRTSRNLQQQLIDERDINAKEKDYFKQEIERLSKSYENKYDKNIDNKETDMLREEIRSKDEVICNICSKYLKMKCNKNHLQEKIDKLHKNTQKTYQNIIHLLEENRKALDGLLNKMIQTATCIPNSKRYLKLLKVTANLHYENIEMKIQLTHNANNYSNSYKNMEEPVAISSEENLDKILKCTKKDNISSKYLKKFKSLYSNSYAKATVYDFEERRFLNYSKSLLKTPISSSKSNIKMHSDPCIINMLTDF